MAVQRFARFQSNLGNLRISQDICYLLSNTASWSTNNARNEYKYHTIFVLATFPGPGERLKTLASQNFGKTKTLDNKSLIRHFSV